jgi:predicted AlkP superfamily phosphohydrolase/phosphomutase
MDGELLGKPKVLVIGLDGATWNLIKPWADEGKLPTIKKLMNDGIWGELESSIPFVTCPAWKCYSTGKNPGKLGVFNWVNFNNESKKVEVVSTSTSFRGKEIWDYLGENDFRCGIINMPLTYPPKQVNGFMVCGPPALDRSNYTFPLELKTKLKESYQYQIMPKLDFIGAASFYKDQAILESMKIIKNKFTIAKRLLKSEKLDFLHLTIFSIDTIQHFFWNAMEIMDERYGNVMEKCWMMIDYEIGELLKQTDSETHTFLMSDHGFTKLKASFHINMWLIDRGYLRIKDSRRSTFFKIIARIGLTQDRIMRLMKYKIFRIIVNFLSLRLKVTAIRRQFLNSEGEQNIISTIKTVDWEKTKAIAIGENCININLPASSNEYEEICKKISEKLKLIVDPMTNEVIFENIRSRKDVYEGEFSSNAPDLLILPKEGYRSVSVVKNGDLWSYPKDGRWSGCHKLNGIFAAQGPKIKNGIKINDVRIYDLAPTILYLCGLPIPSDMDGKVLIETFEEEHMMEHPITELSDEEVKSPRNNRALKKDKEEIIERLKKLGYI